MTDRTPPIKLFYVDDDEEDIMLMGEYLAEIPNLAIRMDHASGFEEAQAEIARDCHDIYIFDYRLAHRSGAELLRWAIGHGCVKPIILMTGYASPEVDAEALEHGAVDYLDKSRLSAEILDHAIRYAISQKSIEARLMCLLEDHAQAEEKLRNSESRLRNILENILEAVITADRNGQIRSCNAVALEMFGYREEEMIGMNVSGLCAPPDRDNHDRYIQNYLETGEKRILDQGFREVRGLTKQGDEIPIELAVSDPAEEGSHLFIATIRDIRERKEVEQAMEQARRKAETANQAKSIFLANMSHELRTPLNAILGFAEMITQQIQGPVPPKYLEYAGNILQSGEHLLGLVSDLLDLSRVEEGQVTLCREDIYLPDLVISCRKFVEKRAEDRGITVVAHSGRNIPLAALDPRRMRQLILNLLDNAIKFSPDGSEVRIRTDLGDDGRLKLEVVDRGEGIPSGQVDLVLEKFVQLPTRYNYMEQDKGAGLGLALVKAIVDLHGGLLEIESEPGAGTMVRVTLPLHEAAGDDEPALKADHLP